MFFDVFINGIFLNLTVYLFENDIEMLLFVCILTLNSVTLIHLVILIVWFFVLLYFLHGETYHLEIEAYFHFFPQTLHLLFISIALLHSLGPPKFLNASGDSQHPVILNLKGVFSKIHYYVIY